MKKLPEKITEEKVVPLDYAIARFMRSKKAFKTGQGQEDAKCWFKVIKEKNVPSQVQLHFRFVGFDRWYGGQDDLDCDFYINIDEFCQAVLPLIEEYEKKQVLDWV